MKHFYLLLMAVSIFSCASLSHKPKGDLIYCSYCCAGAAGLGTDYCELIADPDSVPRVAVTLDEDNRFGDPVIKRSYPVDRTVVDSLAKLLFQAKAYKLDGYNVNEPICGGHSNRIHIEYSSGDKVNAFWYGNKIKDDAIATYNMIEHFFAPWCKQARKEANTEALVQRVTEMETLFDRVNGAAKAKKAYPELREDFGKLKEYMDYGDWKKDFEADERGELPENIKRGVLSEDGLYNLLNNDDLLLLLYGA